MLNGTRVRIVGLTPEEESVLRALAASRESCLEQLRKVNATLKHIEDDFARIYGAIRERSGMTDHTCWLSEDGQSICGLTGHE